MIRILLTVLITAAMAACSYHATRVVGPDGTPAIALRCRTPSACYKAAGKKCPGGYEQLDEASSVDNGGFLGMGTAIKKDWLIRCR